jgi:hypothetical protein
MIDGYTNTLAVTAGSAAFLGLSEIHYGTPSSPTIQLSYPQPTSSQRN